MHAHSVAPLPGFLRWHQPTLVAAIVDLDGTLVDTLGDFVLALHATLHELGLAPVDAAQVRRLIGKGSEHLVRSVLQQVAPGAPEPLQHQALASYQRHYLAVNGQQARVYPGAVAGLQALQARGFKLACLTNKPTAFAQPLLQALGLAGFFSHVFGGDAFARKKPDPLPVLQTCAALGCPPAQTLVIGDSSNDAQAARAAGCPVLLVTYGYNHGEPVQHVDADAYADSLAELVG